MRISAKARYACLAMIELAKPARPGVNRQIRKIAEAQGIPERYLVQILLQLKAAGLVHSTRGSEGGYGLARGAEHVTVADILLAIDGPGEPTHCDGSAAARELGELLDRAKVAQHGVLAGTTIAELAGRDASPIDWVL